MRRILSEDQLTRYNRQIILKEMGQTGQDKLLSGSVLVIGAGGLGSPAALYLAAAGIGTIGIADYDNVDPSNLQRQIIHNESSVGTHKSESAKKSILAINSDISVKTYFEKTTADTLVDIINGFDFVIDATDNFDSKFFINDTCVKIGVPFSHAGVLQFHGQTTTVVPKKSACYRCVFCRPPQNALETCSEAGILGPVAGVIGSIQATEAIKYLIGAGDLLVNQLLTYDALSMNFRKIETRKNPDCAACRGNG